MDTRPLEDVSASSMINRVLSHGFNLIAAT